MDSASRGLLARRVRELAAAGTGVVIATHDDELIQAAADRVVVVGGMGGHGAWARGGAARMNLVLVSLAGVVAFALLFVGGPFSGASAGLSIAVGTVAALLALELGTRRLDARRLALLAALAALDAGLGWRW